jgi:hypothetical protein
LTVSHQIRGVVKRPVAQDLHHRTGKAPSNHFTPMRSHSALCVSAQRLF